MDEILLRKLLESIGTHWELTDEQGKTIFSNMPNMDEHKVIKNDDNLLIDGNYFFAEKNSVEFNNKRYTLTSFRGLAKFKKQVFTDKKTGVLNLDGLLINLEAIINQNIPCVLCVFDIDNFKKINDEYNHLIGDKVLGILASIFRYNIKKDDLIGRFGGDEFILLLTNISIEDAKKRVQEIVDRTTRKISVDSNLKIPITVSMGVCAYDPDLSFEDNFKIADDALYHSKNSGKNKITFADTQSIEQAR